MDGELRIIVNHNGTEELQQKFGDTWIKVPKYHRCDLDNGKPCGGSRFHGAPVPPDATPSVTINKFNQSGALVGDLGLPIYFDKKELSDNARML